MIQMNATDLLTLSWSPPFLWPGERILHYNVLFTTERECIVAEHRVNSNYSDQVVSFTRRINYNESPMCSEIKFYIFAIGIDTSVQLQAFNATKWIMPSSKNHCYWENVLLLIIK